MPPPLLHDSTAPRWDMDPDAHTCILTHVYVGLHASMAQQYNNVDYRQWGNHYKQKMVCFFLLFFPFCLITTTDPYIHLTTACIVSQSEGLGWTNNHNQHNKGLWKGKWWCASAVSEGKSLMGRGMLLHQRSDADIDRGHSWWLGVMEDEGNRRLEPSYSVGSARTSTELK